jgi:hypothetical protein
MNNEIIKDIAENVYAAHYLRGNSRENAEHEDGVGQSFYGAVHDMIVYKHTLTQKTLYDLCVSYNLNPPPGTDVDNTPYQDITDMLSATIHDEPEEIEILPTNEDILAKLLHDSFRFRRDLDEALTEIHKEQIEGIANEVMAAGIGILSYLNGHFTAENIVSEEKIIAACNDKSWYDVAWIYSIVTDHL